MENQMETNVRSNTSSASAMSQDTAGPVNGAASSTHAVIDSIAGAADQAARRAEPAIDRVAAMAHQAVNTAASVVAPTANWLTEQGATLKATQKKMVADTCNYVSANPMKSVGIAAMAGFVLSFALLLFRDRKRGAAPPPA
jgi:ElaB/YqjD/DUF883 family membrane-anchored ribosome-binding protein